MLLCERELPGETEEMAGYLTALAIPIARIGLETGTLRRRPFLDLTAEGFDALCLAARQANAASSTMRNNTDRNDARGIARILRTGWFGPVHMKRRVAHASRFH